MVVLEASERATHFEVESIPVFNAGFLRAGLVALQVLTFRFS
jgi:hypothetical protein